MPLDPQKIALAMSRGVSAVCSTCVKYWEARDKGVPGDRCLAKEPCGSPLAGDTFHEYDGPMKGALHLWCFYCGAQAKYGLKVGGKPNIVGVCKEHVGIIGSLRPIGKDISESVEVKSGNGAPPKFAQFRKNALVEAIIQTEKEWAEGGG